MKSSKWTDAATLTDEDLGKDGELDLERQLDERRQLYEALDQLYPGLKCVFMSGYTADALANRDGVLEEHVHFLQKPYSRQQLADKIQAALE